MIIGVRNQNGTTINIIKNKQIKAEEKFLEFVILTSLSYTDEKINAMIIAVIIDNKIGFNNKKDKTIITIKIIAVIILPKNSSLIFSRSKFTFINNQPKFIKLCHIFTKSL